MGFKEKMKLSVNKSKCIRCGNFINACSGMVIEFSSNGWGYPIPEEDLYVPHYGKTCVECGSKLICNGCADCGRCNR